MQSLENAPTKLTSTNWMQGIYRETFRECVMLLRKKQTYSTYKTSTVFKWMGVCFEWDRTGPVRTVSDATTRCSINDCRWNTRQRWRFLYDTGVLAIMTTDRLRPATGRCLHCQLALNNSLPLQKPLTRCTRHPRRFMKPSGGGRDAAGPSCVCFDRLSLTKCHSFQPLPVTVARCQAPYSRHVAPAPVIRAAELSATLSAVSLTGRVLSIHLS